MKLKFCSLARTSRYSQLVILYLLTLSPVNSSITWHSTGAESHKTPSMSRHILILQEPTPMRISRHLYGRSRKAPSPYSSSLLPDAFLFLQLSSFLSTSSLISLIIFVVSGFLYVVVYFISFF